MAQTFGTQPSDVVMDAAGNVRSGIQLDVYPDRASAVANTGKITALRNLAGVSQPGYLTSDAKGRFAFTIDGDPRIRVAIKDPSGDIWEMSSIEADDSQATLDGGGKLASSQIPSGLAKSVYRGTVANQAAMITLSAAVTGDWCIRSDQQARYDLTGASYATAAHWTANPDGALAAAAAQADADQALIDAAAAQADATEAIALASGTSPGGGISSQIDAYLGGDASGLVNTVVGKADLDPMTGKVSVAQLPDGIGLADATATVKGGLRLAGDLGGSADVPTVPGLASKAADNAVVKLLGNQTVAGVKTFTSAPVVPDGSFATSKITGLGDSATRNVGTASGTVKAGNWTPTVADVPAGSTLTVVSPTTARPTARTDVRVIWLNYATLPANAISGDLWLQPAS